MPKYDILFQVEISFGDMEYETEETDESIVMMELKKKIFSKIERCGLKGAEKATPGLIYDIVDEEIERVD